MMPSVPVTSTEARGALTSLTEQHITQLIREAVKVQHHCKRGRIHLPNDKNSRGGYSGTTNKNDPRLGVLRRRLHANDINMALQWRGSEKIYATGMVGGGRFVNSSSRDDKKIMLKDYLKTEMKFKPPQEVGLTLHWLAVDGVQPDIPQNPSRYSKRKRQVVHRVDNDDDGDEGHASGDDGIQVTQLLPRLLSEELRLYFKRITVAVESGGANPVTRKNQDEALSSLSHDPGLQELAPFMINYVTKNLYNSVGNPEHCRTLIRMAQALLINPHIHLELYVRRTGKDCVIGLSLSLFCRIFNHFSHECFRYLLIITISYLSFSL
jgi:transcription initiation factor TFIID subunit 6